MKISEKLLKEWDFERNDKDPHALTHGSGYKAWWTCATCHYHWDAAINENEALGVPNVRALNVFLYLKLSYRIMWIRKMPRHLANCSQFLTMLALIMR